MDLTLTGKTIAQLRKFAGLTQASLAEKLGVSDKAVSKWERGIACPDPSLWNQLSILLDTDIESLLYGHGQSKQWIGVLILDEKVPVDIIVYNKPLVHYLISQFLLVGIKEIVIVGRCEEVLLDNIKITIVPKLNHRFTKNAFVIYGNQFTYGPNLTKHFMRAMSRNEITVMAVMKGRGKFGLYVDSEKKAMLSNKPSNNKYYAIPYVFLPAGSKIKSFETMFDHKISVETMVRGMVHFNINDFERVYQMAGFIKMMEENTGESIADLQEIIERRKLEMK